MLVLFLYGWSLPRCEGVNLGVFHLRHFDLLTGSSYFACSGGDRPQFLRLRPLHRYST